jgi:hypothetical protein
MAVAAAAGAARCRAFPAAAAPPAAPPAGPAGGSAAPGLRTGWGGRGVFVLGWVVCVWGWGWGGGVGGVGGGGRGGGGGKLESKWFKGAARCPTRALRGAPACRQRPAVRGTSWLQGGQQVGERTEEECKQEPRIENGKRQARNPRQGRTELTPVRRSQLRQLLPRRRQRPLQLLSPRFAYLAPQLGNLLLRGCGCALTFLCVDTLARQPLAAMQPLAHVPAAAAVPPTPPLTPHPHPHPHTHTHTFLPPPPPAACQA